ncbi:MAG: 30S ribosomal protein S9 [Candidatus Hydrothermota bacterium]|nr:MAG: 30S ribosomal protein S9 [Candidatus Hydrothermae bacterium]
MEEARLILASGSRKRAIARVRVRPGRGWIYINGKRPLEYFRREDLVIHALEPLKVTGKVGEVDVIAKVEGGGLSGQAGAVRLAIARALCNYDESLRPILKEHGMLTRDPREKERMKYGLRKRRRAHQYSKR